MASEDPIKAQFDILRKRAQQAATTATQQEREGLKRRFASIGQVGSGAQIRAEAQLGKRAAERIKGVEETVGLAELAEKQRRQELGEAREFARGEREASQAFGAEQAGLQRQFSRGERLGSQDFAGTQAGLGREFARGERLGAQEFATVERQAGQRFAGLENFKSRELQLLGQKLQSRALDLQRKSVDAGIRQFDQEFKRDSAVIAFNQRMTEQANSEDLFEQLGLPSPLKGLKSPGGIGGAAIGTTLGAIAGGPVGAVIGGALGSAIGGGIKL